MNNFFFVSLLILIGLSAAFNIDDITSHNHHHLNQISPINEKQRIFQNAMKNFINMKRSESHSIDDEKQQYPLSHTKTSIESMSADSSLKLPEDFACLEACNTCIEDYPAAIKSSEDCGPVCECANSCSYMSIEQIDIIYGQSASRRAGKGCFLKVYVQLLNNMKNTHHIK
ncbi:unnamed protein product [Rotaria sordida]|uniref:Uncharacterized protein n=1 Tax=Rotaria sordida TaxID=392033 RepID=A0A814XK86_9BILA|nr:unnamed protein product [Rotaria sordida]CAF1217842.1 unnamed protein product [Rotaria sordida]CAF1280965.1 unnamed protein product [Rotaria sordida]CAF1496428.1 unnamed protein product [Rotaria sordida]CAF3618121.1 unnamed protein product [Rotaria sordida]